MARANQTTGLTNGRAASRAPEVGFSQMTFPFCCQISQFSSRGGPRKQRKSSLSKNLLFSNWPTEGPTLIEMSTNLGYLGWFLFFDKNIKLKLRECGAIQAISYRKKICIQSKYLCLNDYDKKNWSTSHVNVDVLFQRTHYFIRFRKIGTCSIFRPKFNGF